jgi:hypothetical protein
VPHSFLEVLRIRRLGPSQQCRLEVLAEERSYDFVRHVYQVRENLEIGVCLEDELGAVLL